MSNVTINSHPNFQFLSVCHYITTMGFYFSNRNLISPEDRNQSLPILNTFFDYLESSQNEEQTKLQTLRKILYGSDLYGGGENETLDMKYVNETYQYIISNALFSQYGNIHGYLAHIINGASNITYEAFKNNVFQHLSLNYTIEKDYCSSLNNTKKLTSLSIQRIFRDHIWPIFPQPKNKEISILDVNYLYAMVGLKFVRSISTVDMVDLSFDIYVFLIREFILNSKEIDSRMINELFLPPALLLYAHRSGKKFKLDLKNSEFFQMIYQNLYHYFKKTMIKIIDENIENSLHDKLRKELGKLRGRTLIAAELLEIYCIRKPEKVISPLNVFIYKTFYHFLAKLILPEECDELPNLETVYRKQFTEVGKIYKEIEKLSIEKILIKGDLIGVMNSPDVVVKLARPGDYPQRCNMCSRTPQKMNESIYLLFAVINNTADETEFYALKQANGSLVLLTRRLDEKKFYQELSINRVLNVETAQFFQVLKKSNEMADKFIQRVADMKRKKFLSELYHYYRNPTEGEIVLNILKAFIPFYSCAENAYEGKTGEAVWSCSLDVVSLLPLATFSTKYTQILKGSLTAELSEVQIVSRALSNLSTRNNAAGAFVLISRAVVKTVVREIISRAFFQDLTMATLRTFDPGFEITYQIMKFNLHFLSEIFRKLYSSLGRMGEVSSQIRRSIESIMNIIQRNVNTPTDSTGLVPRLLIQGNGYDVLRYLYPGGEHFFGPRCVRSFGTSAELRTIEGKMEQIPVVPVETSASTTYRKFDPKSGELSEKFEIQQNGLLKDDDTSDYVVLKAPEKFDPNRITNVQEKIPQSSNNPEYTMMNAPPTNSIIQKPAVGSNNPEYTMMNSPPTNSIIQKPAVGSNNPEYTMMNAPPTNSIIQKPAVGSSNPEYTMMNAPPTNSVIQKPVVSSNHPEYTMMNAPPTNSIIQKPAVSSNHPEYTMMNAPPTNSIIQKPVSSNNPEYMMMNAPPTNSVIQKPAVSSSNPENTMMNAPPTNSIIQKLSPLDNLPPRRELSPVIPLPNRKLNYFSQMSPTNFEKPSTVLRIDYVMKIGPERYSSYIELLTTLKTQGLPLMRKDKQLVRNLRLACDDIAHIQYAEVPLKSPIDLWHMEVIERRNVVEFLKKLKGTQYYFNDITLLTSDIIGAVKPKIRELSLETIVYYHMKIDQQYGLVDLNNFHDNFRNQYIIYPDVTFTVTNIIQPETKNVLILEMEKNPLAGHQWRSIQMEQLKSLMRNVVDLSKRIQSIERAAEFLSLNVPLCKYTESKKFLMNFILKMDVTTSYVPTYDKMVEDIYNNLFIPELYHKYQINRGPLIDDVLFDKNLETLNDLPSAVQKIYHLFNGIFEQPVSIVFENYISVLSIQEIINFEDYYVLYSFLSETLIINKHAERKILASTYRLALRQCQQEFTITKPIILYRIRSFETNNFMIIKSYKKRDTLKFGRVREFSLDFEMETKSLLFHKNLAVKNLVLYEIEIKNQAGIANVDAIMKNDVYIVPPTATFIVDDAALKIIEGREVYVIRMHEEEISTEERMVKIVEGLNTLFSSTKTNVDFFQ